MCRLSCKQYVWPNICVCVAIALLCCTFGQNYNYFLLCCWIDKLELHKLVKLIGLDSLIDLHICEKQQISKCSGFVVQYLLCAVIKRFYLDSLKISATKGVKKRKFVSSYFLQVSNVFDHRRVVNLYCVKSYIHIKL